MRIVLIGILSSLMASSVASTQVAAPGQVNRPGEISPPNVWVQNRGVDEAIPVNIVQGQVLQVQVAGAAGRPDNVLPTLAVRQTWDYTQARIAKGEDAATTLNGLGAEGWEVTGVQFTTPGGTIVVLKRPR